MNKSLWTLGLLAVMGCAEMAPELDLDGLYRSTCVSDAVVALVNDPGTSANDLRALGVYSRGASRLVAEREAGVVFETLSDVDAVPYIGEASLEALIAGVDAADCDLSTEACDETAVLDLLNRSSTDADVLRELGVYSRGATQLVAARESGTVFTSMDQVDDTKYVGDSSLDALLGWGADQCLDSSDVDVIFSPQPYYQSHLAETAERLQTAQRSLDIAMYSFSDEGMYDAVAQAIARGVSVRIIFQTANDDRKDPEGSRSERLEAMGADVRWVNKIMHHKYVLIDGPRDALSQAADATLVTGSGNWSYSAGTKYDENTLFVSGDDKLILSFQAEFNLMWSHSRDFESDANVPYLPVNLEITEADIAAADGAEAVFTSANFRTYMSDRYGWTFSARTGEHAVADRVVELIEGATASIHIASGHMRSKQVADALIAKHAADPGLDIRVYLDGQEWISSWWQNHQRGERDDCLEQATTDTQRTRCEEVGHYFGKDLVDAGIDVKFDYYAFRWNYRYAEQMHHKYILIDGETVFSGSYNLSANAEQDSFENAIIFEASRYPAMVDAFEDNFEWLWTTNEGAYDSVLDEVENGTDATFPIVWAPMALAWSQVDALKRAVRSACPVVDSDPYRDEPERHMVCERPTN